MTFSTLLVSLSKSGRKKEVVNSLKFLRSDLIVSSNESTSQYFSLSIRD